MAVNELKGFTKFTTGTLYFVISFIFLSFVFRFVPDFFQVTLIYFCVKCFIWFNDKAFKIWFPEVKK
jgi:hypothetical protein